MRREELGVVWTSIVVVMAALIAATKAGSIITMDIQNTFTNAEIVTECFSSAEHIPATRTKPGSYQQFRFDPDTQDHWKCIIATLLVIVDPSNPPPMLWGWFYLFTSVPVFRPCYDAYCIWLVGPDGVSIVLQDTGEKHRLYSWPSHPQ